MLCVGWVHSLRPVHAMAALLFLGNSLLSLHPPSNCSCTKYGLALVLFALLGACKPHLSVVITCGHPGDHLCVSSLRATRCKPWPCAGDAAPPQSLELAWLDRHLSPLCVLLCTATAYAHVSRVELRPLCTFILYEFCTAGMEIQQTCLEQKGPCAFKQPDRTHWPSA